MTERRSLRALYICYLGLDDPLVHSQVVAYLRGLAGLGNTLHLVTFEVGRMTRRRRRRLREQMAVNGIAWVGLRYHKQPSLPATAYDVLRGALLAAYLVRRHRLEVLHARAHVPAAMALIAMRLSSARLLFDIRGLMAEEYVDAGSWNAGSLPFRITKRVERAALARADGVVVLTERVREILLAPGDPRVEVIPCCVDVSQVRAHQGERAATRARLGIGNRTVLIYVGKFGGWYLHREMIEFFVRARKVISDLHFLVLSQSDPDLIAEEFERFGVERNARTITRVPADQVSRYLAAADAAVSFIKPCHSKISSSPTKIGEYLASGLPIVSGRGIGDVDALLSRFDSGVLLDSFEAEDLMRGAQSLRARMDDADHADRSRRAAETLSLTEVGVPRYAALYSRIATTEEPGRQPAKEILTDRLGNVFNARPIPCPICGTRDLDTLGKRGGHLQRSGLGVETNIVSCRTCSLIFPDPFPFPADPQKLYGDPDAYFASHDTDRSRRGHRALIARSIALAGMPSPRILDIGCGRGDLLDEARSMGIECAMGLDFAASMVEFARQHFAIDVSHMTAEEFADSDPEPFDIVFLNAVIEHVYDPGALLASVARLTRPGGVLMIDTPREPNLVTMVGNATQRLTRSSAVFNLSPTWPPFHVFGFNPKSLHRLLALHGFELGDLRCHTGNPVVPPTPGVRGHAMAWAGTQVTRLGNVSGLATNMDGWARRRP